MNQLQERLLIVLTNLGGSGTPEDIQRRAEIGKHIDVIKQSLRDLEMQGKVTLTHETTGMVATIKTKGANGERKAKAKKPPTTDEKTALVRNCLEVNPNVSTDEIAEMTGIPRGSVAYHKNRVKAAREALAEINRLTGIPQEEIKNTPPFNDADDDSPDYTYKPLVEALNDLKEKLNAAPSIEIENLGLKVDVLTKLADILINRTITNVLLEIKTDLINCSKT